MRALVTGGAGFIGSHTVDLLLQEGHQVRILDSLTPPVHARPTLPDYVPRGDVEVMVGDVRDYESVDMALRDIEVVFHLAAYQDYLPDFSKFATVNDAGTALLYELMVAKHRSVQRVVLASSQAVYGEGRYACPVHGTVYPEMRPLDQLERRRWEIGCPICGSAMQPLPCEEGVVRPHNQYAVSKYAQELYALTLGRRHNIPSVVLRYSITNGPRQSFRNAYSGICRSFTMRLLKGRAPVVYEDGRQLRDYVHVGDVARANLMASTDPRMDYGVFNVGGARALRVLDYAEMVSQVVGMPMEPEISGHFRVGDTRHVISDYSRLRSLGWAPQTPIRVAVKEYVAWIREQPEVEDYYQEAEERMLALGTVRKASGG